MLNIKILFLLFSIVSLPSLSFSKSFDKNTRILKPIEQSKTCLDEYIKRNKKVAIGLLVAPPVTYLATPVLGITGALATAGVLIAVGATSQGVSYLPLAVGIISGYAFLGAAISYEVIRSIEYFQNRFMIKLIDNVRSKDLEGKHFKKFLKKFYKKYPQSIKKKEEIFDAIYKLDESQKLCNGTVKNTSSKKVRKQLAKRKHLIKFIEKN